MDILTILKDKGNELYIEELDFYVTELETGNYSTDYVKKCLKLISEIKTWKQPKSPSNSNRNINLQNHNDILINPSDLIEGYKDPREQLFTVEEQIKYDIETMRNKTDYNSLFRDYFTNSSDLNEDMISRLFNFFNSWELDELLIYKSFSEEFLEKFFTDLNHTQIAKYQHFSENFFMKHFEDLNYNIVLKHGVNDWKKKENRSHRLDVFLRLKGVTI